ATVYSNVHEAARMAEERPEDLVIFEGSGASFPDVECGAGIVCVPANIAPPDAASVLRGHLQQVHGCEVVGMSHRLSDRKGLRDDLEHAPSYDVLLTELKAGAVDVAVRHALAQGKDV